MDVAKYHFLCSRHGPCGSVPIEPATNPASRRCPVCGDLSEVWVGADQPSPHRTVGHRSMSVCASA